MTGHKRQFTRSLLPLPKHFILEVKRSYTHPQFYVNNLIPTFSQARGSIFTMQISAILTTLALAATALAACPNGPYSEGGSCAGACDGAQRCSKNTDHVVRIALALFRLASSAFWSSLRHFSLHILHSCVLQALYPVPYRGLVQQCLS